MNLKISVDLDNTVFEWDHYYESIFGKPKNSYEITKNVRGVLLKDKNFWLNQPLIRHLNFTPRCYCTARIISKSLIRKQIQINNLPNAPVYQVHGYGLSKAFQIKKSGSEVHIDDSLSVFIDLNLKGIPCLLIDSENNQKWGPIGRIYSLNKEEIEECYYLFKNTLFSYFKELVDEYKRAS